MAWRRVNHPSEIVNVGDTVKVQIVRINPETQRISLGMKQLQADPWAGIEAKYPVGARFKGTVTNIADYGAFVELEPGVEGAHSRLRDELDQEKHPPRKNHVDQSAGGRAGS